MSKTLPTIIPAPAMLLLDFIVSIEAPRGYDTIYGNNHDKLPKPLTQMTLGEVIDAQKSWTKRFKSSAAGGPQFMRQTLIDICNEIPSLRGDMLFDKVLQQKLGYHLLLRRGYDRFVTGEISIVAFGKALAQEWASFPVLAACEGQQRLVERGQSFYAGDGLNKALVSPERVEAMLRKVLAVARQQEIPDDPPEPTPTPAPATVARRSPWAVLAELLAKIFGSRK